MLKGTIEKELGTKIEAAKDVLDQLNKSLEVSHQNCVNAKDEIAITAELLQEMLLQRKSELIKEVDTMHNAQVRPLQDAIKSTYITMGRLQSMLSNLESFDQGQLVNIRIPDVDTSFTLNEPAQINASLECENLKEDLKEWGNVTLDGFECYMMDISETLGPMYEKRHKSVSESTTDMQNVPSINKENQNIPEKLTESRKISTVENLQMTWSIENWLNKGNPKKMSVPVLVPTSDDGSKDEFLVISSSSEDMDFVVPFQELDNNSIKLNENVGLCDDGASGSSILCIGRESQPQSQQDDMSIWLRPKKTKLLEKNKPSADQEIPILQFKPVSVISNTTSDKKSISSSSAEKRILDFPCLLLDNENWIRKKKSKSSAASSSSICSNKTNSFLQSQRQQNLVPPAYALPNPFWLKKYQMR